MNDPMKEFKELLSRVKAAGKECKKDSRVDKLIKLPLSAIERELSNCIEEFEKSHTEQNTPLSIDFGELAPEMLKIQCGFGEKE